MNIDKLCAYVQEHGFQSYVENNKLYVYDLMTKDRIVYREWVEIKPTFESVRKWLGY